MKTLNDKQKKFCQEYTLDLNATQAAIRAGYSEKTAYSISVRLLKKVEVQAEISRLQAEAKKRNDISFDRVISTLLPIAESNIANFCEIKGSKLILKDWQHIPKEILSSIAKVRQTQNGISIDLHPKTSAIDTLNKMLGFYLEDNRQKLNPEIDISKLTIEERKEYYKLVQKLVND